MPVKKVGKHWEVNGEEYDTEAKANAAYQASVALQFGVEPKKSKKSTKKKPKKDDSDADDEDHSHED